MASIKTNLTTSGNSTAVVLPKVLLALSGLHGSVELEARKGQIIIKQRTKHPRAGWARQIERLTARYGDPTDEFADWRDANLTDLDDLPWDGPSYEEWLEQNAKH